MCLKIKPHEWYISHPSDGRLAQLVRAPALHAGGHKFESCTAHHITYVRPVVYEGRSLAVFCVKTGRV